MRYLLAKITQHIDVQAYGEGGGHGTLGHYIAGSNDIEHILPVSPSVEALAEFGESEVDYELTQRLGNLAFVEKAINRLLGNRSYSQKSAVYSESQFLLAKCQASHPTLGVADQITRAISTVPSYATWNRAAIEDRQKYLAGLAREVWALPPALSAALQT
jgi:hypothetical protein